MTRIVVTACGCIDGRGFGSHRGLSRWADVGASPARMRWRTFSDEPFDRFGRLDLLAKYALVAVEMLGLPASAPDAERGRMAIALGTEHGSLSVDVDFYRTIDRPGGASPLLFPYTLPSTAVGEIAIRFSITGPNMCYLAGRDSRLLALWEGVRLVEAGEADACVCVICDAVSSRAAPLAGSDDWVGEGFAYAVLVETEDRAAGHGRRSLAGIEIEAGAANATAGLEGLRAFLFEMDRAEGVLRLQAPAALRTGQVMVLTARNDRGEADESAG